MHFLLWLCGKPKVCKVVFYFHIGLVKTLGTSLSNIGAGVGAGLHCFEPAMGFRTMASKG
jgi:hypothetical protein